jgi:hypothetical protein
VDNRWRAHLAAGGYGNLERVIWRCSLPVRALKASAMRLHRPRLTIRLMMVVVAVAALALAVEATRRRMADLSSAYIGRARAYERKALLASMNALVSESAVNEGRPPNPRYAEWSIRYRRLSEFHLAMKRKYERAATRPWLPIAPDPAPPPEP